MKKLIHRQKNGELEEVLCELKNHPSSKSFVPLGIDTTTKQGPTLKFESGGCLATEF
jgi:hypothetical protein